MTKTVDEIKPNNAPFYVGVVYPKLAAIFQKHGYALAIHGSVGRDLDLIAVPWGKRPHSPKTIIREIEKSFYIAFPVTHRKMRHGRVAYTISISSGDCYVDLSFFPDRR